MGLFYQSVTVHGPTHSVAPQGTVDGYLQSLYGPSAGRMSTLAHHLGARLPCIAPPRPANCA